MANVFIFNIVLMLILPCVESCFIPASLYLIVPQTIPVGYEVTKVEVADCDAKSVHLTLKDPSFDIKSNGAIVASAPVRVSAKGRTFSVWVQDNSGSASEMEVHLVHSTRRKREHPVQGLLRRTKRRWSPPPFNILENEKGPFPHDVEKVHSDSAVGRTVYYKLTGPGYDQYPVGLFGFQPNGMLSVNRAIDREEFPSFTLTARVFDQNTNEETDLPLPVRVRIDDVNDNAPQFVGQLQYTVLEHSIAGTIVGLVNTTDRDDPSTDHVKVRYSLLSGSDLFAIHPETGVITTRTNTLDREVKDIYLVTVQIKDRNGADSGLQNTGTATITLGDINDNPPTFTKTSYETSVPENESDKLILRIPVEDKDLINTPNWISKFIITKGNENGNFRIDTDPKTNEGLLYITKPLDYEKNKNVNLEIMARNEAELSGTSAKWLSVPVNVNVINVDEGPEFTAPTVWFTVKENTPNGTRIGTYTAIDPETKSSNGIKYYKIQDPASWINVDRITGELKVANTIDRESSFVQNGLYNITMKAVDATSKTGTGTVVIQVEDLNDNIPVIPGSELVLCEETGGLGSTVLVAEDKDQPPFSSPFTFSLPPDSDGKWTVTRLNDTSAVLKHIKELPTGIYNVPVDIRDLQGSGRIQTAKVKICQCKNGACLAKESSVALGPLALLAMLLPLALLLLLGLLLAFFCVTKGDKIQFTDEGDSGGILLKSNTEGKGEEVDPNLLIIPAYGGEKVDGTLKSGWQGIKSTSTIGPQSTHENGMYKSGAENQEFYSSQHESQYAQQFGGQFGGQLVGSGVGFDSRHLVQDSSLLQIWKADGYYLQQKLDFMKREEQYADDLLHTYGFEGRGSAAGSVGCCSDFGDKDNLDFINTLGPKFKTLADICTKK